MSFNTVCSAECALKWPDANLTILFADAVSRPWYTVACRLYRCGGCGCLMTEECGYDDPAINADNVMAGEVERVMRALRGDDLRPGWAKSRGKHVIEKCLCE